MVFDDAQIISGKQFRAMIAPIETGVLDDDVVAKIWICQQPPSTVVDVNFHFPVHQQRTHRRVSPNKRQVAWIYLDNLQRLSHGIVSKHLRPRTRRQADHQDPLRGRMESTQSIGTDNHVLVFDWVNIKVTVIDSTAEDGTILGDGNYAVAILQNLAERRQALRGLPKDQFFEQP